MTETEIVDLIVGLFYLGIAGVMLVASYIVGIFGYLKMADATGYKNKFVAFIPIFRMVIFNRYMDDKVWPKLKGKLNWLLIVFPVVLYAVIFGSIFILIFAGLLPEGFFVVILILYILFITLLSFIALAWSALYYYVTFEFYKSNSENGFVIWFVLTFFFGFLVQHIAMIVLAKNIKKENENVINELEDKKDNQVVTG